MLEREIIRRLILPRPGSEYLNSWQKRALDLSCCLIISPVVIPLMAMSGLAVKLIDGGEIVYSQGRVGKDGQIFNLYKLKTIPNTPSSMIANAQFVPGVKAHEATRLGKFLRRWGINELPQIINIVKGDMSIFGIRPLPESYFKIYQELPNIQDLVPRWKQSHCIARPAWISLTAGKGRHLLDRTEQGVRRRMRYEIFYTQKASFCFDLFVLKWATKAFIAGFGAG